MTYLTLFYIFFKVGLFTIGGGLASLGLLHEYLVEPGYISPEMFYNIFAISQSTPGPIGVNMATYVGYEFLGFPGAVFATFSLVLPSFIIITIIAYSLKAFNENRFVIAAFTGFRPAAIAIILSVAYMIINNSVICVDNGCTLNQAVIIKIVLCLVTLVLSLKFKVHPLICILIGGIIGGIFL